MWMMGCNDGGDFNMPDSFNGRTLRPLVTRSVSSTNNSSTISRIHGAEIFALNHHHHHYQLGSHFGDKNNLSEFNTPPAVVVSSRWNPTPEQLRTLEELYRRGTRTPSADQIQHITTQLRRYGKIEGKNVFYWFQNHKARERQKRRRQMESSESDHEPNNNHHHDIEIIEQKDSGGTRSYAATEQTKSNWPPFSTYYITPAEMMQLSCPCPSTHHHLINTTSTPITSAAITTWDLNILVAPSCTENGHGFKHLHADTSEEEEDGCGESQTLQLFPLRSLDDSENRLEKETDVSAADIDVNSTPCQFFEFLPLKN